MFLVMLALMIFVRNTDSLEEIDFLAQPDAFTPDASQNDFRVITDSVQCYSCMSKVYENLWGTIRHTYNRPQNFSNLCDKDYKQQGIGLVTCPSICIKMWEDLTIGGYPVRGYIRGCYDNMLVRGFNQTLVRWYRWLQRDSCHYYSMKDILQIPTDVQGHINICTCYSDGCNGAPTLSGAAKHSKSGLLWLLHYWPTILALLLPFFMLPPGGDCWNFLPRQTTVPRSRSRVESMETESSFLSSEDSYSNVNNLRHISQDKAPLSAFYCGLDPQMFRRHHVDPPQENNFSAGDEQKPLESDPFQNTADFDREASKRNTGLFVPTFTALNDS